MVEMLGIDVGDDRDRAVEPQEAAVALVGLDHHPVGASEPGVGAVGVDDPAVDHGRIDPAGVEHRRDHRGGGRLAVGAGDRDGRLQAHQLGQHLGPADHRDAPLIGADQLGIVLPDRGRDHHHRRVAEIVGMVADLDRDARPCEAPRRHSLRRRRSPAPCSPGCASPRRCPTCRSRRSRRNGSCRCPW